MNKIQNKKTTCFLVDSVKRQMLNVKCSRRGFTLLETLVAISILLIAVVAPMSTIGGSLSSIFFARDQMIAINFAQEGIEVVRQKRDSNMLKVWNKVQNSNWYDGLVGGDYFIDPANISGNGTLFDCGSSCNVFEKKSIRQDTVTELFYQTTSAVSTDSTQFTRIVNIKDVSSSEKIVTSTVEWSVGSIPKKVEVKESIFGVNS